MPVNFVPRLTELLVRFRKLHSQLNNVMISRALW
jgi:hypothetical protein